ncbi:hypothetical protein MA16_Dca005052 [Dendrobium catenatum]|uniref:DUF3741 domain-containing protein n=1 Tax=Dendrobium catenatum TaxID=906689 RepID=A0A2I0WGT5_9ASPA|nr:hypothetical protein MA16_Dca005052 [Dendrobium catenatum]
MNLSHPFQKPRVKHPLVWCILTSANKMNGLDLPLETASRNQIINENFEVKQSSLKNNSHEDGSSVKMLMNEMYNREKSKCGGQNVVARLMNMDTLLPKTGPAMEAMECLDENLWKHSPTMSHCESTKVNLRSLLLTTAKSPLNYKQQFSIPPTKSSSSAKPHRREHSQEEQLQKFKKEFEAWQESKLWEFSSSLEQYSSEELKNEQILALENLKKEKMAAYTNICLMPKIEDDMAISREKAANSSEPASTAKFQEKRCTPCSPTRIVILKPGSDMKDEMEVPWHGSLAVAKKGGSMEDFLEEVKERLRLEMEGKGKNGSIRRLGVGHTSLHESSTDAKQQAREAAKHGAMLRRSQSLITYRSAFHFDEQESSKSIKRETRKFIYDRLKNVLKDNTEMKEPMLEDENIGKSLSAKETAISRSVSGFSKEEKDASFWEEKKAVNESIPKHLRHEQIKMVPLSDEAMSLSNFDGSFFASGTGSAEDGRVAPEAQNFQKHEASKNDSAAVKKRKKYAFSIKSTVSNLKRNLGLRGNFFGKKASSMGESTVDTVHHVKSNETAPLAIINFGIVQDNSTEVPPSPASFSCSPINEHHSPVSPFEDPFGDGHSSAQVSGELSMSLLEFGSSSVHVERERCGMATQTRLYESNETILTEGCGEAYVRDILVVSGFYRSCWPLYQAISRMDGQVKPISSCVFDEVEEKCRKLKTVDDDSSTMRLGDIDIDRKIKLPFFNGSPSKSLKEM